MMLLNYLKIAWRNLRKYKLFSVINIAGLATGLAVCWIIALYVAHETSYDSFQKNADRIFRVVHKASWPGGGFNLTPTSGPYGPTLKEEYPEVEQYVRFVPEGGGYINYSDDKQIKVDDIFFTDPQVFDVFTYPLLYGNPKTALQAPHSIVLTKSLATKFFGGPAQAMGKAVVFGEHVTNTVTGVMKDLPDNTQIQFSALRSLPEGWTTGDQNFSIYTYLLLKKHTDVKKLEAKFPDFYQKYVKPVMGNVDYKMELQPLTSIYLHSHRSYEIGPTGSMDTIYLFIGIAVLILLVACINYMNLSTARASIRVREVGVRKAIGSGRRQLAGLFLGESIFLTLIAIVIGLLIAECALPWFNQFAHTRLQLFGNGIVTSLIFIACMLLVVGGLSGSYPALVLSGYKTTSALKGELGSQKGQAWLRKGLVTFQFVITIVLIAASLVTYRQLYYMINKDLGFNEKQVLTFHIEDPGVIKQLASVKAELTKGPYIDEASGASNPIGNNNIGANGFFFEKDGKISHSSTIAQRFSVDPDFLSTMQIDLLEGRNFSEDRPVDKYHAVIVNQTLVKKMGWKDPVGKRVEFPYNDKGDRAKATVVGVVRDFNIYSLQHKIEPLVMEMAFPKDRDNLYVRIDTRHTHEALGVLRQTYAGFDKVHPMEIHFLDQNFAQQYVGEKRQKDLFSLFTLLAIGISCLGLLGLTAFMIDRRQKEIGIRKILGASISGIVSLLSKDFLKLVVAGFVIAAPIAWYVMNQWLANFAYHIDIGIGIFALAGILAVLIALITVCWQSVRAALANPVESLRNE